MLITLAGALALLRIPVAQFPDVVPPEVQVSTRYPGGVALRFARVLRYRPDKQAAEADTLETVRALAPVLPDDEGGQKTYPAE